MTDQWAAVGAAFATGLATAAAEAAAGACGEDLGTAGAKGPSEPAGVPIQSARRRVNSAS